MLRVLADLAPSNADGAAGLTIPTEWFQWLPLGGVGVVAPWPPPLADGQIPERPAMGVESPSAAVDREVAERLAAVDQIRPSYRSIRVGWLFVAGRLDTGDGATRRVFHPLVSAPVKPRRPPIGGGRLVLDGDAEVSELITDRVERHRLERSVQTGGGSLLGSRSTEIPVAQLRRLGQLEKWARDAAAAAGLPTAGIVPATAGPDRLMDRHGLTIVAGLGVYADHETGTTSRAGSLRAWAADEPAAPSGFHSIYLDDATPAEGAAAQTTTATHTTVRPLRVESPFTLTDAQEAAVLESRHAAVSLVSGAPGTGKSHTIAAIAIDALHRGQSVLVAAKADATVDALVQLFQQAPGPQPVVFGSNERRQELADRLSSGRLAAVSQHQLEQADRDAERAWEHRRRAADDIASLLRAETLPLSAKSRVPTDADLGVDLAALLRDAGARGGWWRRWRARRRRADALGDLGLPSTVHDADALDELATARAVRARARLETDGGLTLDRRFEELARLDAEARDATARWLALEASGPGRLDRASLGQVAALATALRSGRAARREQLGRLDAPLFRALPLWLGSLGDIDDLLPARTGSFDLVVIDEASSVDQLLAAPALLRGKRAVVVGDPRQLRHVSFLSSDRIAEVLATHGVDGDSMLAARLDVRRNSTFDTAAAVTPVRVLDEHFRCDPHLVDFVTERLYRGEVEVATRRPSTHAKDCLRVVRLDGTRTKKGVVEAEVAWCVEELRKLRRAGASNVGIVTPFRAQAEALEDAVLGAFSADDLTALDLRVGTVHAFQGNERNYMIVSLALDDGASANSWRFAQDPHLFAVMTTRARRRSTVLVSGTPPDGLLADYLASDDEPPGPPAGRGAGRFAHTVGDALAKAGVPVVVGYPSGHHLVDVACRDLDLAIECGVHPRGPEAHIRRRLELELAGWRVVDAHESRWGHRVGELVVHLLGLLTGPGDG